MEKRFSSVQRQAVISGLSANQNKNFETWITASPNYLNLLVHTFAHFDYPHTINTASTTDESMVKAHGLTDSLLYISQRLESGESRHEICNNLKPFFLQTMETLFRVDFAPQKVKKMLIAYKRLKQEGIVKKSFRNIQKIIRFLRVTINSQKNSKRKFDQRQVLTRLFPTEFLLQMQLVLIYQEAFILKHSFTKIFDILEVDLGEDIRTSLNNHFSVLLNVFDSYPEFNEVLMQDVDYTRFNRTLLKNLDFTFEYDDGNYTETALQLITQLGQYENLKI